MNGIPLLDAIPVNWFILGVSILAGVILFLILTQIPDDDDKDSNDMTDKDMAPTTMDLEDNMEDDDEFVAEDVKPKKASKKRKTSRK